MAETRNHESRDIDVRWVLVAGALLAVMAVLVHVLVAWMHYGLAAREPQTRVPAILLERRVPPDPRLQVTPAKDMREMRAAEEAVLESYGWVDDEAGIARIPIRRAMEILAEKGLPVKIEK